MEQKKIQLYPFIEDLHTIHKTLVTNPPNGYKFVGTRTSKLYNLRKKISGSKAIRMIYHKFLRVFKTTRLIEATQKSEVLDDVEVIFSQGLLPNSTKPWVLYMFDHPACLAGNSYELFLKNKQRIAKVLLSPECKKIICTNQAHIPFLKKHFSKKITDKVEIVELAVKPENVNKVYNKKKIRILFMGSINIPQDFFIKGGLEVIKVFKKLSKRKDVDLIIRCHLPESIKKELEGTSNLKVIDKKIPYRDIVELYKTTDILFMPGHNYSVSSFLEAMSYGIPIVALDTYAVGDFVENGTTGLVIKRSEKIKGYNNPGYPTFIRKDEFMKEVLNLDDPSLIDRLTRALENLIKNPSKIKKMGLNARKKFEKNHTIKERNMKLKKIFDDIIQA
ncbi:glycosyltransferase family 4 protein [Candidatus Pacearchaeota archaeon]|nr:glycosyltransferase family 4 protein [Candidatus Pacearchaeota archaeon]OIO42259.1 MAG: hypothetical protein AUJ63_03205 [Candidatus Pacearchaeota archaeon CG1_02_35_32]